ncbi:MAG TPA: 6,7-dimethyl-8-ribityllumazine synthase [Armatimonadota bacterium]|jgi:6,7-dimethyl-8-ribityllumazine synthase
MAKLIEGQMEGKGLKFGVIVARYNSFITGHLLDGVKDGLARNGAADEDLTIMYVPGAFEIPLAALKMAQSGKFDAVITIGAVIRGTTPHFDFVAGECAKGVAMASMQTGVPVIFGVITTDTIEQSVERAGARMGNKGFEAALTAIEMVNSLRQIG